MRAIEDTTALVTGATDGLGRGVAERLAALGATVHLHGRDAARLAATRDEVARATGNDRLVTHRADLASLDEVRALAEDVERSTDALHVLVSNAGIGSGAPGRDDAPGEPRRPRAALRGQPPGRLRPDPAPAGAPARSAPARVVLVASLGQAPVDFDDVQLEHDYDGGRAYAQSKLAQITTGFELADRLAGTDVTVTSLHPATYMPTKIVLEQAGRSVDTLEDGRRGDRPARGRAGARGRHGPLLRPPGARPAPHPQAYDADARRRLWDVSRELTGAPDVPPAAG